MVAKAESEIEGAEIKKVIDGLRDNGITIDEREF